MSARAPESEELGDSPLDAGIKTYVETLAAAGVETFESCEGGEGHSMPEPTVRFHGERGEGFRALAVALQHGFPVTDLRRYWPVMDGEPTGPYWELIFRLSLEESPPCPNCRGRGFVGGPDHFGDSCDACDGTGIEGGP